MIRATGKSLIFITHEFFPRLGGIATFTQEMALAAVEMGHRVELWAPEAANHNDALWPFPVRRLPLKGSHDYACIYNISQEIVTHRRKLRRATVYLPEPGPIAAMMYLQFFKAFRPGQLILTFHGSEIIKFARHPYRRFLLKRLLQRTHLVSCVSRYTQNLLLKHFPCAEDKVILTPCALPSRWKQDFLSQPPSARSPNNSGQVHLLTVGRLHPRKGQLIILGALRGLSPQLQEKVTYTVVGNGNRPSYRRKLENAARLTKAKVVFTGGISDRELESLYQEADLFAMTSCPHRSSIEGFGLVYLEAAAHGLPVIGHDIGGVSDAVHHEKTGLLVPPGDNSALIHALTRLIEDPDLRRTFGEAGRTHALQTGWEPCAQALFPIQTEEMT